MTKPPATAVVVVQTDPVFGDVATNLDAAEAAIGRAGEADPLPPTY